MRTLICPTSPLRINRNVVRITGFMMASMIALYALTSNNVFIAIITIDYFIRAFTPAKYSPFSWLASQVASGMKLSGETINKAPKIFAARVGFSFALATLILSFVSPLGSLVIGLTLMGFALLESILDLCMGCIVYTYIVLPIFGKTTAITK